MIAYGGRTLLSHSCINDKCFTKNIWLKACMHFSFAFYFVSIPMQIVSTTTIYACISSSHPMSSCSLTIFRMRTFRRCFLLYFSVAVKFPIFSSFLILIISLSVCMWNVDTNPFEHYKC